MTNGKTFEIAEILERKHVPLFLFLARAKTSCPLMSGRTGSADSDGRDDDGIRHRPIGKNGYHPRAP